MPQNIEIKAKLDDANHAHQIAKEISAGASEEIQQRDTFFSVPEGRLKLRDFLDGSGELIFYKREDSKSPAGSYYQKSPTADVEGLRKVLSDSLETVGEVEKTRHLYLCGRTRIHIDEVKGLGDFLELEVVLEGEESDTSGIEEATALMQKLSICDEQLVHCAYVDLLAKV